MSAQPKRAPQTEAAPEAVSVRQEVPQLRSRSVLRIAIEGDRRGADAGEVSRLQGRLAHAFAGPARSKASEVLIKLLIVAATCLFVGAALVRSAPLLSGLAG